MSDQDSDAESTPYQPGEEREFACTADELLCLISLLDIEELVGVRFPAAGWAGKLPSSLDVGWASLLERGIVTDDSRHIETPGEVAFEVEESDASTVDLDDDFVWIDATVATILGAVSNSDVMVLCTRKTPGEQQELLTVHLLKEYAVAIFDSGDDFYTFRVLAGNGDVEDSVLAFCHRDGYESEDAASFSMSGEEMTSLLDEPESGQRDSQENPAAGSELIARFRGDLRQPLMRASVVAVRSQQDGIWIREVTTIAGDQGLWRVSSDQNALTVSSFDSVRHFEEITEILTLAAYPMAASTAD
ncbi:MAG: hypothetical protein KF883_04775 [Thermomicrobiales bacterium]|nr:hypothetical protein [Thermomicrobiales bacterium]